MAGSEADGFLRDASDTSCWRAGSCCSSRDAVVADASSRPRAAMGRSFVPHFQSLNRGFSHRASPRAPGCLSVRRSWWRPSIVASTTCSTAP